MDTSSAEMGSSATMKRGLVARARAMPRADGPRQERLEAIPGAPPDLREDFRSCPFAPRCAYVVERCRQENPPLLDTGSGHQSACWRWEDV